MLTPEIATPLEGGLAKGAPGFKPGASAGHDLILLRAAFGQDEANHGTARYPAGNYGLVHVPFEAVGPLTTIGGFVLAEAADDEISVGVLKLHHEDAMGCSFAGLQYLADANGNVVVPAEAASELLSHGFVPVLEEATVVSSRAKPIPNSRHIGA